MNQRPSRHPVSWRSRSSAPEIKRGREPRQSTAGQPRGLSHEPALESWSPKSLNDQLHEPPEAFGGPHKNPTSPPPGPPPQVSHGHDGIPRHPGTPAKIETKTSPEQAKLRCRRLSAVPIGGGQGRGRTADLPLFRGPFIPEPLLPRQVIGPAHPHCCWPVGSVLSLALVPPCTGECRRVRVAGVLICAEPRTCFVPVLLAAGPLGHGRRQPPDQQPWYRLENQPPRL